MSKKIEVELDGFYRLAVESVCGPVEIFYDQVDGINIREHGAVVRFNFKVQKVHGSEEILWEDANL